MPEPFTAALTWLGTVVATLVVEEAAKAVVAPAFAKSVASAVRAATQEWSAKLPDNLSLPFDGALTDKLMAMDDAFPAGQRVCGLLARGRIPDPEAWAQALREVHKRVRERLPLDQLAPFFAAEPTTVEWWLRELGGDVHRRVCQDESLFRTNTTSALGDIFDQFASIKPTLEMLVDANRQGPLSRSAVPSIVGFGTVDSPLNALVRSRIQDAVAVLNEGHADAALAQLRRIGGESQFALVDSELQFKLHNNIGVALVRLGRVNEAFASFNKALSLHADPTGQVNLAWCALGLERYKIAVLSARSALSDRALRGRAAAALVAAYDQTQNDEQVLGLMNEHWFHHDAHAMLQAARFFVRRGRREDAITALELPLSDNETAVEAHLEASKVYLLTTGLEGSSDGPEGWQPLGAVGVEELEQAQYHLDAALSKLGPLTERLRPGILINRGLVAMASGDSATAEAFWQDAISVEPSPAAALNLATLFGHRGEYERALGLLRGSQESAASRHGRLFMADLLVALGRGDEAAATITDFGSWAAWGSHAIQAASIVLAASGSGADRDVVASAAVFLVEQAVINVSAATCVGKHFADLGDYDRADAVLASFNGAGGVPLDLLALRGSIQAAAGRYADAIETFAQIPKDAIPAHAGSALAVCYYNENRLGDALRQVEALVLAGGADGTALEVGSEAASHCGDTERAILWRRELASRGSRAAHHLTYLAKLYLRDGFAQEAEDALKAIDDVGIAELHAAEQISLARVMREAGDARALDVAYRAWERGSGNPDVLRDYVIFFFELEDSFREDLHREVAVPGTAVEVEARGRRDWVSILETGDSAIDPKEYVVADSSRAKLLLGARVGDQRTIRAGQIDEVTYTVSKVISKYVRAVQETSSNLTTRHHEVEGFWMVEVDFKNPLSIMKTLARMTEPHQQALEIYGSRKLPMAVLAAGTGRSLAEVQLGLMSAPGHKVHAWDGGQDAQHREFDAARSVVEPGHHVVMDPTALTTLFALPSQFQEAIVKSGPSRRSLRAIHDDLMERSAHERRMVNKEGERMWIADGQVWGSKLGSGPMIHTDLLKFCREVSSITPSTALAERPGKPNPIIAQLGWPTALSIWEAQHRNEVLWTDDALVAQLAHEVAGVVSMGTRSLLQALVTSGAIGASDYVDALLWFARFGYSFLPLNVDVVCGYLERRFWMWSPDLDVLLSAIDGPDCTQETAIPIGAGVLKELGLLGARGPSDALIVASVLDHLSRGRDARLVLRVVELLLDQQLILAPVGRSRLQNDIVVWKAVRGL